MHEDTDDYEPDMDRYYNMDPDERRLRNEKYQTYVKYCDGKISYDQYIDELESYFYEILETDEWNEIKRYKEEQCRKIALGAHVTEAIAAKKRKDEGLRNAFYYLLIMLTL